MHATFHTNHIFIGLVILTILYEEYKLGGSISCTYLYSPVTSFLGVTEQVSYTYETTGHILCMVVIGFFRWDQQNYIFIIQLYTSSLIPKCFFHYQLFLL